MEAIFEQAIEEFESKNYSKAYNLFKESAQEKPKAMFNLAIMHMKGQGCNQSYTEAQKFFEAAAEYGNAQALNSLAIFYEKGMAGETSESKALEYYKRAADLGLADAQLKTGMLLRQSGKHTQAMQYLITAAHNNNAQAQSIITYVSNQGVEESRNEAFHTLDREKQYALIANMIEKNIRPTLANDGGGIELLNYIAGEVPQIWLHYQGTCSGCHLSSTSTADMLLDNFENLIDKNVVLYLM